MVRKAIVILATLSLWPTLVGAAAPKAQSAIKKANPVRVIPATGTLGLEDLARIVMPAINPPERDPFHVAQPSKYIGRKFSISQTITTSSISNQTSNSYWSYTPETTLLSFYLSPGTKKFSIYYNERNLGQRVGQNAFGVKVQITEYNIITMHLHDVSEPDLGDGLIWTNVVEPAIAKPLVGRARLVIEGEIAGRDGEPAECELNQEDATIDQPEEVTTISCNLYARIERLAFMDGANTLKAWVRAK